MEQNGALIAVIGDEETVTGMLLAGVGNVDARRTSNFMVVDSKTTPPQIEDAFKRFTSRSDVAIVLINQYIASKIRPAIEAFTLKSPCILEIPSKAPRHVETGHSRAQASADAASRTPRKRQTQLRAALSLGQPEHPYDSEQDAIHRRTKLLLGIRE